jgi:hypothetical protein
MPEIVYILTNEAMPGLVKIGRTSVDLAGRIKALYQTGVPLPFELFFGFWRQSILGGTTARRHEQHGSR